MCCGSVLNSATMVASMYSWNGSVRWMNESVRPLGTVLSGVPHLASGCVCTACAWVCIRDKDLVCVGLVWMRFRRRFKRFCASWIDWMRGNACMRWDHDGLFPISKTQTLVYRLPGWVAASKHRASASLVVVTRCDLALLVSDRRPDTARRGVKVADPVARDLVALVVGKSEHDAVGPLELDFLACEDEILCLRLDPGRHRRRLGVDMDVDGVGDVIDGRDVGSGEDRLCPYERGDDTLEQGLGIDERDAAEGGVGGRLPEFVADHE